MTAKPEYITLPPAPDAAPQAPSAVGETVRYLAMVDRFTALLPAIMQGVDALNQAGKQHFADISSFEARSAELFSGLDQVVNYSSLVLETSADYTRIIMRTEEILKVMLASIDQTLELNDQTGAKLRELDESAARLQSLVTLLTNLAVGIKQLSRNAEIKAYHAGGAGRGFSVIAESMNRLAGQMGARAGEIPAATALIRERLTKSLSGIAAARDMALALKDRAGLMRRLITSINEQNQRVIAEFDAIRSASRQQMAIKQQLLDSTRQIAGAAAQLAVSQEVVATALSTETAEAGQITFVKQQQETVLKLMERGGGPALLRELAITSDLQRGRVREAESRWRSLQDSMAELRRSSDQEEQIAGVVWENLEQLFDNIHAIGGNLDATGALLARNREDAGQIAGHLDRSELDLRQLQEQWGGFGAELAAIARSIGDLMVSVGYLNSFTEEIKLLSFYESVEVADLGLAGREFRVFVDQTRELALQAKGDADQLAPLFEDVQQKFGHTDRIIGRITGIIGDNLASITQARWSLERSQEAASQFELIGQEAGQTIAVQNAKRQEVYHIYTSYTASYKQVSASLAKLLALLGQGFGALSELAQAEGRLAGVFDREAIAATDGQTLRLSLPSDPITLDPAFLTDATSNEVAAQLHAGLVQFDDGARVMPAVARSWSISGDGLTWTFYLRKGVTFHHGRELVADDVKYSWERLLDPAAKSPNGLFVEIIRGAAEFHSGAAASVDGIRVIDDHCLQVTLRQPYMPFLANLAVNATAIVPREHTGRPDFATNPVGAGPFRMRQWLQGRLVAVERNQGYYEQRVSLGAVEWQVGLADEQRLERLLAGAIDTADIHARDSGPLAAQGRFVVKEVAALNVQYLCINVSHQTPFQHKLVRQALNCAIDKQALIDSTELRGEAIVARGTFPPRLEAFNPGLQGYPYDPARAKGLLAEAGFAGGLPGQYLLDVRDIKAQIDRGTMVIEQCQKVGIRLKLNPLSWKALLDRAYSGESLLSFRGWSSDNGDPDNFLTPLFHSRSWGKPGNTAFFKSAEIDALLEQALAVRNPVERLALYRGIEARVVEEAPWVFLYHSVKFTAMQPKLHGFRVRPFGAPRLKDCWLE